MDAARLRAACSRNAGAVDRDDRVSSTSCVDHIRIHRGTTSITLGDGRLAVSAAALSLASLFVGHDSGPLHIAGAFGVPVVGVFAPGQPDRTFPQGVGPSRVIHRPSPAGIDAGTMLREIDALAVTSSP